MGGDLVDLDDLAQYDLVDLDDLAQYETTAGPGFARSRTTPARTKSLHDIVWLDETPVNYLRILGYVRKLRSLSKHDRTPSLLRG